MADKLGPLKIPANLLKEDTSANRKEIRNLIRDRIDYNKAQRPPLPFRDGLPKGRFNIGDSVVEIKDVSQYARGKGNPTIGTVSDTGKVREGSLLKQTSKTDAVKRTRYGRGARGLKPTMQDHHIRFRTLFEPFYEGLDDKQARELTEWFVQGKSPLGNVLENLEGVDTDLHSELKRSIHQWAKENQLQIDAFSKEEWQAGARNIDPKTGLVRGGANSELFIDPKEGMATLKAKGARPIPKAKFPNLSNLDLNERKNAARLYLDTIEEPLLNKTAEILEEQDLRYAAKDPTHKPKTKTQWLDKWDKSTTAGARTSEWLEDVAEKNPDLDVRMSDIDDIIANPDAPLSKAAAKRLKVKPTNSALSALKRIGIGGAVELNAKSLFNVTPGALAMGALDMFERVLPTEARTIQAREEGFTKNVALGYVKDTALKSTVTGVVSKTLPTLLSAASKVPLLKASAGVVAGVASSPVTIAVGGGLLLNELVNVVDTYYDGEFKPKLEDAARGVDWGGSTGRY